MNVRTLVPIALLLAFGLLSPDPAGATTTTASAAVDSVETLFEQAGRFYGEGRYRQAIPVFRRVVKIDPRHANAFALLGGSYFQLGDYQRAIQAFERALQLDEGIKLAYLGLVASNYLTERVGAARHWLQRMVPILDGEERDRYLAMIENQFPLLGDSELGDS
ncbi:MAG: tetratricopeptide repeat protein [Gemmatimonadota bacterium]|nr:tetratricopeptide repeat protein [Gemmatimonadota bacterium]